MSTTIKGLCAALLLTFSANAIAEGDMNIGIQKFDATDAGLVAVKGDSCAEFMKYLKSSSERYNVKSVAAVNGPPGVVYTMENFKGEIAILKCGTACSHGGETDEGGGGGGEH